ncbi:hypothetical protein AAC387_Pa03g0946 [Persea americana]
MVGRRLAVPNSHPSSLYKRPPCLIIFCFDPSTNAGRNEETAEDFISKSRKRQERLGFRVLNHTEKKNLG